MREGIVTHVLSMGDRSEGTQEKFMGIARLSPSHPHRRLDIIIVPYDEIACALL
jgi:hypothetical protein